VDEELRDELAKIRANQTYMIKLLETVVELIPPRGKQPRVDKLLKPLIDNPMIKNNPQLSSMVGRMIDGMGGEDDEH
jgi:hypothetical protein